MKVKKWLFLPFLGGGSDRDRGQRRDRSRSRSRRPSRPENGALVKHESADAFANKGEEELVQDYNAPIRWYMLATLFPLIAGTFGPMASMFNICAIAIPWRLIVDLDSPQSQGEHINDPRWLVAVNIVSLVIAILANVALLGQMTNRLRFNVASPVTIVGWYISGFIDIALAAVAPSQVPLPADNALATYSQAYYYCIFSGAIYVLLSIMLSCTAWGVWIGNYSSEFKLSLAQRSLMLQTILFLAYVLAAGGVYARVEGWDFLNSVYYIIVTLFTIGFGDFSPETHTGRSLYFPMSVGGIIFVGLIIANIRSLVLESTSVKVSTRLVERMRYKSIKAGSPEDGIVKVRGVLHRDTNAPTELARREKEFEVMREIQAAAAHNNRMIALSMATMAFMILWFIGSVCFWQAEKAVGGNNWSYFEALYFTYTAQLTIGYGDFGPQTNSAKPTFVFWSLIALPTLTVLIGAVGDAVTDFVNWYTLWLGKHAPNVFKILTGMKKRSSVDDTFEEAIEKVGAEIEGSNTNGSGFHNIADIETGRVVPAEITDTAFGHVRLGTVEEAYKPFLMLQAARKAIEHLDEESPRKYTFQEWSWILKLLGEDEATEENHRRVGQPVPENAEVATPVCLSPHQVWSWMGQESPLMSLEEGSEPKWVLKRLMEVLELELKRRGDLHVAQEADITSKESDR
ncbi:voltage-gated potassium channel [Hortaea werneckii]|nr:voltage-gated potassium channel [Hortaea werneckii]KAI7306186.1 voltage-gated potassium channel [Hortaea werneckii]